MMLPVARQCRRPRRHRRALRRHRHDPKAALSELHCPSPPQGLKRGEDDDGRRRQVAPQPRRASGEPAPPTCSVSSTRRSATSRRCACCCAAARSSTGTASPSPTPAEVDRFLALNEFDPAQRRRHGPPRGAARRRRRVPDAQLQLPHPRRRGARHAGARSVAARLLASGKKQTYACIVLKVMHVMHHLAGRELLFKLPVSDDEVFGFVEAKVVKVVEEIRAAGYPIVEFAWSRKERDSVVTKLLAKKATIAAARLRQAALPPDHAQPRRSAGGAARAAAPPGAVQLRHPRRVGERHPAVPPLLVDDQPACARFSDQLQPTLDTEEQLSGARANEFSGPSYSVINFVADLPVRIDQYLVPRARCRRRSGRRSSSSSPSSR